MREHASLFLLLVNKFWTNVRKVLRCEANCTIYIVLPKRAIYLHTNGRRQHVRRQRVSRRRVH
jgi:hypothetical protein